MPVPSIQPGQMYPRNASYFNAFGRAANAFSQSELGGGTDVPQTQWQTDVRLIQNNSGEDCDAGDVLAIDDVVVTPEDIAIDENFMRWGPELVFKGVKPDLQTPVALNQHVGHFAVLLEPIPHHETNPRTGLAVFSGIVTAPIDMVYEDHPFADVAHDTFTLTSNWYGSAEILYKFQWPEESGNWFAAVRMSNFRSNELEVVVSEQYGIPSGSSGDVDVWWGGVVTDPVQTLEAHLYMEGTSDVGFEKEAVIRYDRDKQQWRFRNGEC